MELEKNKSSNREKGYKVADRETALLIINDHKDPIETKSNTVEMRLLCETAGVDVVEEMHIRRSMPDVKYYIGSGNAEEAFLIVCDTDVDVVMISEDLTPTQQRNIEDVVKAKVVDRTQLILDIFAQRARSSEGKLQVELAQLQYLLPRLSGRGIQMSRIGGGSGVATRGPGETKLETDRRRVRNRISSLKKELEEVVKHRHLQKSSRAKLNIPTVALVGYTSAGKSTLLNRLANSDVEVDAKLFATLDPTTRRVDLSDGRSILLSDTVGFIRNIPHNLIAAFKATLEEVVESDILIHVVDASHPYRDAQIESVKEVLKDLSAYNKPIITAFNKCDLIRDQYELRKLIADTPDSCYFSALTGEGIDYLDELIINIISRKLTLYELLIPFEYGDLIAICHEKCEIVEKEYLTNGVRISARIPEELVDKFKKYSI
ncbi:MAG: GTPase HflX [Armatimonadota bacterium]